MAEASETATRELPGIFPGSWIDANFYIWIGHADDQKAWRQLADARAALESATVHADSLALVAAREELLIAEGSDWFWWYGDDHSSAHDLEFDDLFRRHVRNAYRRLQLPVPDELFVTNISTTTGSPAQTEPTALLAPTLDGEETSYFEWLGAGTLEVRDVAGAMHRTDRRPVTVAMVHFGFDHERLFVRIDTHERVIDVLAAGVELALTFVTPASMRLLIRQDAGRLTAALWVRPPAEPRWITRASDARMAAGTVLEMALPFADLGVQPGDALAFFVAVHDDQGVEVERHPAHRPIALTAPDALFGARNWRA